MIREEEDDRTQEMRAFVLLELKQETAKLIEKIEGFTNASLIYKITF